MRSVPRMTPLDIKHALERAGSSQAAIARAARKSPQLVGEVIRRTRKNSEIEIAIASKIGKTRGDVFPDTVPATLGNPLE